MEGSWVGCACQRERGGGRAVLRGFARALCAIACQFVGLSLSLCVCVRAGVFVLRGGRGWTAEEKRRPQVWKAAA